VLFPFGVAIAVALLGPEPSTNSNCSDVYAMGGDRDWPCRRFLYALARSPEPAQSLAPVLTFALVAHSFT
jgi:hypothetical protein